MRPQFRIATEQLELPQLDKAGPNLSDTALLQLHWSTAYPGKLDQWETFRVLAECLPPVCGGLFLEGLIGRGRMMSEEGTLWWNIMILLFPPSSQPFLSYITLLSSCSFSFLSFVPVYRCLVFTVFTQRPCLSLSSLTVFFSLCILTQKNFSKRKYYNNGPLLKNEEVQCPKSLHTCYIWPTQLDKCLST